jgi:hypothetical protein
LEARVKSVVKETKGNRQVMKIKVTRDTRNINYSKLIRVTRIAGMQIVRTSNHTNKLTILISLLPIISEDGGF